MIVLNGLNDPQLLNSLSKGAIGIIPTDTVYGLVVSAVNKQAVERLYNTKGREGKPGTVIAATTDQLVDLGIDAEALQTGAYYWPNPISIVVDSDQKASHVHQGVGSLAVRIPKNEELLNLLRQTGPLLTTSANHPGESPANNLDEAKKYFGDEVDFYVEGGDLSNHQPSTVARLQDGKLTVLRAGAVRIDENGKLYEV